MRPTLIIACLLSAIGAHAQFRYDNTQFHTVFPEDLCNTLKAHPGAILLDVRSAGEYNDTSSSAGLNLGHFKTAINISISELGKRWHELEAYKSTPIFVYCSHSQRSRRASHLLSDSGFTNIYNINGGITQLLKMGSQMPGCMSANYTSANQYSIISPAQAALEAQKKIPWLIVDLRKDSVYRGISTLEKSNAAGKLQPSVNIPFSELKNDLSRIPKDRPVLLVDDYGNESAQAAALLGNAGYRNVSVLLNGMDAWVGYNINENIKSNPFKWKAPEDYTLINGDGFYRLLKASHVFIMDVRPADQFNNQSKNYWENIGRISNARNITLADMDQPGITYPPRKDEPVILYTFNDQNDVYAAARRMKEKGYEQVYILYGGIFNLRWNAYNMKGKAHLDDAVTDIPAENL